MMCTKPISLVKENLWVPCGRCIACRRARAREWAVRLMHEADYHKDALFVTLTYNDVHLPEHGMISKYELQTFFKRLRKSLVTKDENGKPKYRKIKYYATGEYGEKDHRPHYHAIIYNIGMHEHKTYKYQNARACTGGPIYEAWTKKNISMGFITLGWVEYDSCKYVAGYIQKKLYGPAAKKEVQPYAIMSQGLGKQYALDNHKQICDNANITIRGINVGIPKYYVKKINSPELLEKLAAQGEKNQADIQEHYWTKYKPLEVTGAIAAHRKQTEKNLQQQADLKEKEL